MKIEITCQTKEYLPFDQLKNFQGDLKKTTPARLEKLKNSIKQFGFSFPVFVWQEYILDGHQRIEAVRALIQSGHTIGNIPIVRISAEDKEQAAQKLILINSRYADIWQDGFDKFIKNFDVDLDFCNQYFDLPDININPISDERELEPILPDFDNIEQVITKAGDICQMGNSYLICCDCCKKSDVDRIMNGKKAELLFTSPPYLDARDYGGNDLALQNITKFIPNFAPYCAYQAVNLGIIKKKDHLIRYWDDYINAAEKAYLKLLSWNIWDKMAAGSIINQKAMFAIEHEFIFIFGQTPKALNRTIEKSSSSKKRTKNHRKDHKGRLVRRVRQADGTFKNSSLGQIYDHKNMGTVCQITANKGYRGQHPATMPVELASIYIEAMSDKNDIVVDPFAGSGTTLIAAEQLQRSCIAMEIDVAYCNLAIERYKRVFNEEILLNP